MVIFHSYVKLPKGIHHHKNITMEHPTETFSAPAGGATALVPPPPGSSFRAMMSWLQRGERWDGKMGNLTVDGCEILHQLIGGSSHFFHTV
jgi:hypothetical protein